MLVVGHAHAVGQQVVQRAADIVRALHILEHDAQGCRKHVRLVYALIYGCLNGRDAVRAACGYRGIDRTAGNAVAHGHGGHIIHPAAAGLDDDITRISKVHQRLANHGVALFQLRCQKCTAGRNARRIHDGHIIHGRGCLAANHARVKGANIRKTHVFVLL